MVKLLKEPVSMLHILPCENIGSFEYKLSLLVKNGIDERGRFLYEGIGHLRRLNTEKMSLMTRKYGFSLSKAFYSYHNWTAIECITRSVPRFVLEITNPKRRKNKESEIELKRLRNKLLLVQESGKWKRNVSFQQEHLIETGLG